MTDTWISRKLAKTTCRLIIEVRADKPTWLRLRKLGKVKAIRALEKSKRAAA